MTRLWLRPLVLLFPLASAALPAQLPQDPLAAMAAMPVQPSVATGVDLQVLGVDGKPCPQAILVVVTRDAHRRLVQDTEPIQRQYEGDQRRLLAAIAVRAGQRYGLDAEARARVPAERGVLLASAGDAFAIAEVPAKGAAPLMLRLQRERRVRVEVTTHDGKPATGVGVGCTHPRSSLRGEVVRTGADGMAEVVVPMVPLGPDTVVRVLAATTNVLQQPLPEGDQLLRFQLPPCGSVRIELVGGDASGFSLSRPAGSAWPIAERADAQDGHSATFALVEAGSGWMASASLGGIPLTMPVPPVEAGKQTVVRIDPDSGPPRIVCVAIDAEGRPLAHSPLRTLSRNGRQARGSSVQSDADGRIEVLVPDGFAPDGTLLLEYCGPRGDGPFEAYAELPLRDLHAGRNQLGDVRLQPVPLLLSGKVVDSHGHPVAGVQLGAGTFAQEARATTAADGSFALRLPPPQPEHVQLQLQGTEYVAMQPAQTHAAGSTGVVLVVDRKARLLVALPGLPPDTRFGLEVTAQARDREPVHQHLEASGSQLTLPPGKWDLTFAFAKGGDELARIADVIADAGVENHDPRLMQFDWQRFASLATIDVRGPDGEPFDGCTVWRYTPTGSSGRIGSGNRPERGLARWLVPKAGGWILVAPADPKLRLVDLGCVTGEHTVRLQPATPLRLQLTPAPKLPAGVTVTASLRGTAPVPTVRFEFDAAGVALGHAPCVGEFDLDLHVRVQQGGSSRMTAVGRIATGMRIGDEPVERQIDVDAELQQRIDQAAKQLQQVVPGNAQPAVHQNSDGHQPKSQPRK